MQSNKKQETTDKTAVFSKDIIKTERKIKNVPDKKKVKEFITTKPVLHEMLKGPL